MSLGKQVFVVVRVLEPVVVVDDWAVRRQIPHLVPSHGRLTAGCRRDTDSGDESNRKEWDSCHGNHHITSGVDRDIIGMPVGLTEVLNPHLTGTDGCGPSRSAPSRYTFGYSHWVMPLLAALDSDHSPGVLRHYWQMPPFSPSTDASAVILGILIQCYDLDCPLGSGNKFGLEDLNRRLSCARPSIMNLGASSL